MSYPCGELDFLLGDPGSQDGRLAAKLFLLRGKPSGLLGHQFSLNQSLVRRSINSPAIWPDVLKGLWSPRKLLQAEVCRCWPLASWLYNGKPGGIRKKHHFTPALTVPSENPLWQRNRREHLIFLIFASLFSPSVSGCTSLSRDIIWGAYHKSCYLRAIERRIWNGEHTYKPGKVLGWDDDIMGPIYLCKLLWQWGAHQRVRWGLSSKWALMQGHGHLEDGTRSFSHKNTSHSLNVCPERRGVSHDLHKVRIGSAVWLWHLHPRNEGTDSCSNCVHYQWVCSSGVSENHEIKVSEYFHSS